MLAPDYPHGPPAASRPRTEDIRTAEETLKGRVVLVTGAGSGIGRAAALHMAKLGAKVLVADHNVSGLQRTQAEMAKAVPRQGIVEDYCVAAKCDVTDPAAVSAMVATCVRVYGRLDCALNAAGIEGERSELHEMSTENFDNVLGVNLRGTYLCMQAEIRQMLSQIGAAAGGAAGGAAADDDAAAAKAKAPIDEHNFSIVNISSSAGQAGMPSAAPRPPALCPSCPPR